MKKISNTGKRVIYPLLFIILGCIIIFNVAHITLSGPDKVIAYKLENGWGYRILRNDAVVVDQPFIPLLPGKTPFPSKRMAVKTGKLVLNRLQNQIVPVIEFHDLVKLGIIPSPKKHVK
jgi:hypothetical protein